METAPLQAKDKLESTVLWLGEHILPRAWLYLDFSEVPPYRR
jgi:hypothetical protein